MEYRKLGKSGLEVSVVSYGDMLAQDTEENQKKTNELINKCLEVGINYFDTAETYGEGQHETLLGRALKQCGKKREDYVVSTKIYWSKRAGGDPNAVGLSRKHIMEGMNASLKRLQLDYVDIVFCHRPDYETPLEETCAAMGQLVKEGKAFYWGTSEWNPEHIIEAMGICDRYGIPAPVVEQVRYHMLCREKMEKHYTYLFDKFGYGTTAFSPIAGGILSKRFVDDLDTKGTRFDNPLYKKVLQFDDYFSPEKFEETKKKWAQLEKIAEELEAGSLSVLALAWVIRNPDVSTMLAGLTKIQYIEDAVKAIGVSKKFTKEIEERIDEILGNRPERGLNWKSRGMYPARRLEKLGK